VDTFTILINCSVVLFCYFSLNGVNCYSFAWTFSSTTKSLGGVTVMLIILKTLKANYMLIKLLYVYRITK